MFIVIDSSLLHGRVKPETPEFSSLVDVANKIGWKVLIPEPVFLELENGIQEKYREARELYDGAVGKLGRLCIKIESPFPSEKEYVERHVGELTALMKKAEILKLGFPTKLPSVEGLFKSAVAKAPPFDATGNNYRDMVIWMAVKEFCDKHSEKSVFFLTKDTAFLDVVKREAIPNLTHGNYAFIKSKLEEKFTKAQRERSARLVDEIGALASAKEMVAEVEKIVREKVAFDYHENVGERLVSIDGFAINKLLQVDSLADLNDSGVSFRAKFLGTLMASFEVPAFLRQAQMAALQQMKTKPSKIGDRAEENSVLHSMSRMLNPNAAGGRLVRPPSFSEKVIETRERPVVVDVSGVADLDEDHVIKLSILSVGEADQVETDKSLEEQ